MNRLRIAVIGVGALGRHHARILSQLDGAELVAVVDPHRERGEAVAAQCGTRWVPAYHELIRQDALDAVSVVVPTSAHLAVARDFLRRGIPVLVEKPLALDVPQARELVELAEQHQTLLQVGHVERFNPAVEVAWTLSGAPKYIRAERLSPYAFRSMDIGVVHDVMIHDLDLVLDLVGSPVRDVQAFGVCLVGGHEDCVQARLAFENGCIADLTANRVSPAPRRTMQVWSSQGWVAVDFNSREVVAYTPSEALLYGTSPWERAQQPGADIDQLKLDIFGKYIKEHRPAVPTSDALTAELQSFLDCVESGRAPRVGGRDALRAMLAAERVLDSVARHQWDGVAEGVVGAHPRPAARRRRAG